MRVQIPLTVAVDVGTPTTCLPAAKETQAEQRWRLAQIALLGPLMVWGGARGGGWKGFALAAAGLYTIGHATQQYRAARVAALPPPPAPEE